MARGDDVDPLSRAAAEAADAADPLAAHRDRFVHDDERIYLDGNSLGRLPLATRERLAATAAEWGERLVGGWADWIDAPTRTGDLIAEVVGAGPGEVVACDSTTVNLFKLVEAVLDARGDGALVTDRGNFPTDRYVLEGIAARRGLELRLFDGEPEAATLPCGTRRRRRALARRLSHRRARRPRRAPGGRARARRDADLGPEPLGRRRARRPGRRGRRAGGGLHLQVPQRRARARPPTSTSPRGSRRRCARRSGAGSPSASSSRWSATSTPSPTRAASSPARRRSSASRRSRRACG